MKISTRLFSQNLFSKCLFTAFLFLSVLTTNAQTAIIGTGATSTDGNGSDPIDGYFNAMRYQVIYTAADLTNAGVPAWSNLTGLGFSISQDYGGTILKNYTIRLAHTNATDAASHNAVATTEVRTPFSYDPTVTAAGAFDMITFTTNFQWDGTSSILVEICTGPDNAFTSPYGGVRADAMTSGSRRVRADGSGSQCNVATDSENNNRPQIQFSYTPGTPPTCFAPFDVTIPVITSSGVTIGWTEPTTLPANGYEYEIRTSGAAGSGATGLAASGTAITGNPTATVSTLSANTVYAVYIRSVCGTDFSSWTGAMNFTTLCNTQTTFPWTENFEGVTPPAMASCFTVINNNNDADKWLTYDTYGVGDGKAAGLYTDFLNGANDDYLVLPAMTLTGNQRFRFSVRARSAAEPNDYRVVLSTTSANAVDFTTELKPLTTVSSITHANIDWIDLSGYTGTVYLAVHVPGGGLDGWYLYVDNMVVEDIPTCEMPNTLIFSNITATSAQLEWTAPLVTSPVDYQIYYNTSNTAPTSGSTPNILNASSPASITSLTPGTKYYVWVRSNCGAGPGTSGWTPIDSVTTECTAVTTLNENFDGGATPALPDCWGKFLRGTAGTPNVTTSTGSVNSAPNSVLLANSSSTATADIMLVSPPLSNVGAGTHRLRFWARNATASQDIEVGTLDNKDPFAVFTLVQAIDINTTWAEYTVDFTVYSGTDPYIAIRRLSTSTFTSVYIDNIVWEAIPTCDAPTAVVFPTIGNNSAEVEWTAPMIGSPVDYQIYYDIANTPPTGASTPNVTGANFPATITGLTANTLYYVWVRTNCGAGGVSSWSNIASFTTACDPVSTLPWTENFDALTTVGTTNFPDCWKKENGDWRTSVAATHTYNDPRSAPNYLANSWTATDEFIWTPGFQLTAGTSYDFSFWWTGDGYTGWTGDVFYNSDQSSMGATQLGGSFITTATTSVVQYVQFKESFTPSTTGTYYFAIRVNANLTPYQLGFDDFKLEITPNCAEPTAIVTSNPSTNGVQVDWVPPTTGSPVNYDIFYNSTNTAPTASDPANVTGVNSPATLTGLAPATTYYIWVRTFCGGTDYSSWASGGSFTTACNAVTTFPFSEGFDAATIPACWSNEYVSATANWTYVTQNQNNTIQPRTGARMAEFRTANNNGDKTKLVSPPLNLTSLTNPELVFWYANVSWTGDIDALRIFYKDGAAGTWIQIGSDYTAEQTAWTEVRLALPGASAEYYLAFEGASDYGRGMNVDDVWVGEAPTCGIPTSLMVSNVTQTNAQVDWTPPAVGAITDYTWELRTSGAAGSGATGLVSSATTASTTVSFTTLTAGTTYSFYVRTNCVNPDVSTWVSVEVNTAPVNDDCSNAVTVYKATPVNGTTVGSNTSMPADACATSGVADDDVWYMFTADYAGDASIAVTNVSATLDVVIVAYSGTCGAFTSIGCADGPGDGGSETANLTGLNAGETYYFRVWSYDAGAGSNGTFTVTLTGSALPVTLVDFRGEKEGSANRLTWITSTEVNNQGFELQRSADGRNFTALTFVASKAENGNSNSLLNYSYNDVRPLSGSNYYRLKQVDKDGKFSYSDIVVLKSKATEITLSSVYPNPATKELNMIITSPKAEKVTIVVTDLTGKVIMQQSAQLVIGDNQSQMNVQRLAAGTYLIKAVCANGCETAVQRFVKQ